jgi:hypothetical protein
MSRARTGRGTRGDDGAVQSSVSDKVDFHSGVTTGIVDGTSVNLGNGHFQSYFKFLEKSSH